ncbi:MAG TPA: hypothetical protein VFG20_12310, partial [Planctomycetaceae bacterium]|nr:hypothetical protein [Planctomycetaceae bacterium]
MSRLLRETDWSLLEQQYFALLLGLSVLSLLTLALGLAGLLVGALLNLVLTAGTTAGVITVVRNRRRGDPTQTKSQSWWWLLFVAPFVIGMALGALSPSTDFDVNEYHLGGPKEWFLNGRITFLPNNIYTSFPFLTEMLLLAGMTLAGDWFWGALVGQTVLAAFAPLTALGLYAAGRRWHSELSGRLAAIVYLSTPWVFRMSIIAYAEGGLTAYTAGAALATWWVWQRLRDDNSSPSVNSQRTRAVLLTGLLCGSAMACKYTGLVMTVLPFGVLLALAAWRRVDVPTFAKTAGVFAIGVLITIGPWLLKNTVEAGNPVYPLAYSVFGGRDLDDALALKWKRGHARPSAGGAIAETRDVVLKAYDVAAVNDWQSPLVFAFAPLTLFLARSRRAVVFPWIITTWLFLAWWLFTHHIDRFWLPLLPTACLLAGIGAAEAMTVFPRGVTIAVLGLGIVFNLGFCATGFVGYNVGLTELNAAREFTARIVGPEIAWINEAVAHGDLPAETKVLFVGEAEVFPAQFDYAYNTVFDRSLFEEWCGEPVDMPAKDRPLRSPADIRATLANQGITHIYVNWGEIWRYRQSYGYTDFVHPARFQALIESGVLDRPVSWADGLGRRPAQDSTDDAALRAWAPELFVRTAKGEEVLTGVL